MGSFTPVEVVSSISFSEVSALGTHSCIRIHVLQRMVPSGYGKPPQANLTVFGKATPMVVDRYRVLTLGSRVFALVLLLGL